jgi:hypothetical protein
MDWNPCYDAEIGRDAFDRPHWQRLGRHQATFARAKIPHDGRQNKESYESRGVMGKFRMLFENNECDSEGRNDRVGHL